MVDISFEEFQDKTNFYMDKAVDDSEVIRIAVQEKRKVVMISEEAYNRLMRVCVPKSINADLMITEELHAKLQKGYDDALAGRTQDAASAFGRFRETVAENK